MHPCHPAFVQFRDTGAFDYQFLYERRNPGAMPPPLSPQAPHYCIEGATPDPFRSYCTAK